MKEGGVGDAEDAESGGDAEGTEGGRAGVHPLVVGFYALLFLLIAASLLAFFGRMNGLHATTWGNMRRILTQALTGDEEILLVTAISMVAGTLALSVFNVVHAGNRSWVLTPGLGFAIAFFAVGSFARELFPLPIEEVFNVVFSALAFGAFRVSKGCSRTRCK